MRRKARGSPPEPALVALLAAAALIAAAVGSSPDGQQAQQTQPQQQPLPQQASGKLAARRIRTGDFLLSATCNTVLRARDRLARDGHNRFSVRVRLPASLCSFGAR